MSDHTQDAGRLGAQPPAGRYTLDITEDAKGDNPITISLQIEDSSIIEITARDVKGNVYEGAFRLKRVQKAPKPPKSPNPVENVDEHGHEQGNDHGDGHGEGDDDDHGGGGGDGDDDDGECQICSVVSGRTVCRTVVC